ncbi:MAG: hypothetical protein ABI266_00795 [Ginsengibacter sp.]
MEKMEKLEMMDKILRELDDLKNSQNSIMKKIGQIEADNINLGAKILEEGLPDIFDGIDKNVQLITSLEEKFQEHRDKFFKDNNLAASVDPTA